MGNSVTGGGRKNAKVMKIDGEIFKRRTPIQAFQVIKDYAGHVLLESKSVKRYGIRASPLDPDEFLEAGKVYFLVELPKTAEKRPVSVTRRVRSGVSMTAKERLECLMMSRRSTSDLSLGTANGGLGGSGSVRVKVRLPKAEMDRLIKESGDEVEVAERIVDFYVQKNAGGGGDVDGGRF